MTQQMPRGIRNNNPGNIEHNASLWQGLAGSDGRFAKFTEPRWGIRAMAKILIGYQKTHGLETIQDLIFRWAPPVENKSDSYTDVVATACGKDALEPVDITDESVLLPMIKAMITVENGQQPYTDDIIKSGLTLAGIDCAKPIPKPLIKSRTLMGAGVAGVGGVLGLIMQHGDAVTSIVSVLFPNVAPFLPSILTLLGSLVAAYARYDDYSKSIK